MITVLDILLLALAVAAVWKLRSVLGRRTGYERSAKPETSPTPSDIKKFPVAPKSILENQEKYPQDAKTTQTMIDEKAKKGLAAISRADKNFSPQDFLRGARLAYAMIIEAFAEGDVAQFKNLVQPNVAMRFQAEIERRADKNHVVSTKLTEITAERIMAASFEKDEAHITVEIESQQLSWTKDEEGRIIAGDPNTPRAMKDIWTFSRKTTAADPNWRLMATSAASPAAAGA